MIADGKICQHKVLIMTVTKTELDRKCHCLIPARVMRVSVQLQWPSSSLVKHFLLNYLSLQRNDTDKKKLMRFSGQVTLTVDCARKGTSYKYVVVKKGATHWECLLEFPPKYVGGIVDRFLSIPEEYLKPGGKL